MAKTGRADGLAPRPDPDANAKTSELNLGGLLMCVEIQRESLRHFAPHLRLRRRFGRMAEGL